MLKFPPLKEAVFEERPNRFVVRVNIDGRSELAHLHDPGRLKELLVPGAKLYLQKADNPKRKTGWDVILVKKGRALVAIYSILANRLAQKLFSSGDFPGFKSWRLERSEPRFGQGRFDFELSRGKDKMLVEVKSVSLVENGVAMFPDAPTVRGRRHLMELAEATKIGYQSTVVFIVTRSDASSFMPHSERDPDFAQALQYAIKQGVKAHCFKCKVSVNSLSLDKKIPIVIS